MTRSSLLQGRLRLPSAATFVLYLLGSFTSLSAAIDASDESSTIGSNDNNSYKKERALSGALDDGEWARRGEFPSGAHLLFCDGTLVAPDMVLSAALYCEGFVRYYNGLHVGTTRAFENAKIPIVETIVHPDFNATSPFRFHDLMLVKLGCALRGPVQRLNFNPTQPRVQSTVGTVGYALITSDQTFANSNLRKYKKKVVSTAFCARKYQELNITIDGSKQICTTNYQDASCFYDEGSPLQAVNENPTDGTSTFLSQSGVFSRRDCSDDGKVYPDVYTRLSAYREWIQETIAQYSDPTVATCPV